MIDINLEPALRFRMTERYSDQLNRGMASLERAHPGLLDRVYNEVAERGPITARAIDHKEERTREHWGWSWSSVRASMDALYVSGKLSCSHRNNPFERAYDLPERVLPGAVQRTSTLTAHESHVILIRRAARAPGVASEAWLADYSATWTQDPLATTPGQEVEAPSSIISSPPRPGTRCSISIKSQTARPSPHPNRPTLNSDVLGRGCERASLVAARSLAVSRWWYLGALASVRSVLTVEPYADARLVALYDAENPDGPDHDFYRALAADVAARRILDLGCGTGLLTRTLAEPDRVAVGVDPAVAMVDFARRQPGADAVAWLVGDAGDLPGHDANLALMTGNVAQVFLDDTQWARTLACLRVALRRSGTLAFEARNLDAGAWQAWTEEASRRRCDTPHGPLTRWVDNTRERDGVVTFDSHYVFESTNEHFSHGALRFRSAGEISDASNSTVSTCTRSTATGTGANSRRPAR